MPHGFVDLAHHGLVVVYGLVGRVITRLVSTSHPDLCLGAVLALVRNDGNDIFGVDSDGEV